MPFKTLLEAGPPLDGPNTVIWIDDAHEHLEYGFTLARLNRLLERYPGVIVAMTLHLHRLDAPPRTAGALSSVDRELLRHLRDLGKHYILEVAFDDREMAQARRKYPGLEAAIEDPDDFTRLPGWFAGVSYLRHRYRNSGDEHLGGRAIAKAAIDWRRAGMPMGMTGPQLRKLAEVALDEIGRGMGFRDDSHYSASLDWAAGRDSTADPRWHGIALLRPVPGSHGNRWRDFDAVTTWAAAGPVPDPPLTAATWRAVLDYVTPETGLPVGISAYFADHLDVSETAFRMAVNQSSTAMVDLGILLRQRGGDEASAEAERWFRRAIDAGNAGALFNLGILLQQRETDEASAEAEHWYRRAIEAGETGAMANLGLLVSKRGTPEALAEAEQWYRHAIDAVGDTAAMYNLAMLLQQRGTPEALAEAEHWYRQAIDAGDTGAMAALGVLLKKQQTDEALAEAELWYRRAIDAGQTGAMGGLGVMLQQRGTPEALAEAELWYRRAIDAGATAAMHVLGDLLQLRGTPEALAEAELWYRRAIDAGETGAMGNLGTLLARRGGAEAMTEAEQWYRLAINVDVSDTAAMYNLGGLLQLRGTEESLAEAEQWWEQAAGATDRELAQRAKEALGRLHRRQPPY